MKSTNKEIARLKRGSGSNYRLKQHLIFISRRYLFLDEILHRNSSLVQALELQLHSTLVFIPYSSCNRLAHGLQASRKIVAVQHLLVRPRLVLLLIEDIHLLLEFVRSLAFSDIWSMPKQLNQMNETGLAYDPYLMRLQTLSVFENLLARALSTCCR